MLTQEKIAVLAGTPVDTRMGVQVLETAGLCGIPFPLAEGPRQQTAFQIASPEMKKEKTLAVLREAMAQGCEKALVYCNSLSGAVDFPPLAEETGLRIVTPLDVYRDLAHRYQSVAVIAANAQGLSGIEATLYRENPEIKLLGASLLPVVLAIEAEENPEQLIERYRLPELADWFLSCNAEALILGCTHFPYFKKAFERRCSLPLIDPADEMIRKIRE